MDPKNNPVSDTESMSNGALASLGDDSVKPVTSLDYGQDNQDFRSFSVSGAASQAAAASVPTITSTFASTSTPISTPTPTPTFNSALTSDSTFTSTPTSVPASAPIPVPPVPVLPVSATPIDVSTPVNPIINPSGQGFVGGGLSKIEGISAETGVVASPHFSMSDMTEPGGLEKGEIDTSLKAAAPVPGSIGSAVSGPTVLSVNTVGTDDPFAEPTPVQSVPFNDPASLSNDTTNNSTASVKKKSNRVTLIALIITAIMIVIALAGVLIFQLLSDGKGGASSNATTDLTLADNYRVELGTGNVVDGDKAVVVVCVDDEKTEIENRTIKKKTNRYRIVDSKIVEVKSE